MEILKKWMTLDVGLSKRSPVELGLKKSIVPISLDAMALIIHLNTSPMDRTASLVIFTTILHGDTGWLVAALCGYMYLYLFGIGLVNFLVDPIVHIHVPNS